MKTITCSIQQCNHKHHPLLHGAEVPNGLAQIPPRDVTPPLTGANALCLSTNTSKTRGPDIILPIVSLVIRAVDNSKKSYRCWIAEAKSCL
jgi:hypothetical protein